MTNFQSAQIPPPKNWQDFESLCCDLWRKIWEEPTTQKNGRLGQPQSGVDIYARVQNKSGEYLNYGIQCKGKDNYSNNKLTITEIKEEIEKAKSFDPPLNLFIIATTSPKDVYIEKAVRAINAANGTGLGFKVMVMGWNDIVDQLAYYPLIQEVHYDWIMGPSGADSELFEFWIVSAEIRRLQINANWIPFHSYNVKFRGAFINNLQSYLNKIRIDLEAPPFINAPTDLLNAIENFNCVAEDVIKTCNRYENRYDLADDIYTYWVDVSAVEENKGDFIEFRKGVLKCLFFELICAANHVISTYKIKTLRKAIPLIPFTEDFNHSYPLWGSPHPSPEYYPQYNEATLYSGLESKEKFIFDQIFTEND